MTPEQSLDRMIEAARAAEPRLDDATRDAVLDRIAAPDGRFVGALVEPEAPGRVWPRRLAWTAAGLALAAAVALLIVRLGPGPSERSIAESMRLPAVSPPRVRDEIVTPPREMIGGTAIQPQPPPQPPPPPPPSVVGTNKI